MLDSKLGIMYAILPVASRLQIVKCVLYAHVKKCKTQNYDLGSQVALTRYPGRPLPLKYLQEMFRITCLLRFRLSSNEVSSRISKFRVVQIEQDRAASVAARSKLSGP